VCVCVCVASALRIKTLNFFLHSVFMRFIQSSQYKIINSVHRKNRLLFAMEKASVYCDLELNFHMQFIYISRIKGLQTLHYTATAVITNKQNFPT
jgi:hypothetical protein